MSEVDQTVEVPARMSRRFSLISAALAFVLWGGWAFHVNRAADPWLSALTQGVGSLVITLVMVRAVACLYHRFSHLSVGLVLPAVIVVFVTGSCLAAAHTVVATANIFGTIAPALGVAFVFNIYTAAKLRRAEPASMKEDASGGLL
jgi:FtsH-binding integral membrane protein